MASCSYSYINNTELSETEKLRLADIHTSIFKKAKESGAFRVFENRFYTLKNEFAKGTSFVSSINQEYGQIIAKLNTKSPGQHYLSVNTLPLSSEEQGELFTQKEGLPQSIATEDTLEKVKEAIGKMGIDIQKLNEYAKETKLDVKGINGIADITRGIIAIAEGKEGEALTEEVVHISTAILEQTNPKLVTEMVAKIDRFKIYKKTLEEYKGNKNYQLSNGKPDIRKIKKEAVDKLISEVIINNNQDGEQFPELREEANQSLVRKWWNAILDWIRGIYRKANIDIFEKAASKILNKNIGDISDIVSEGTFYQLSDKQIDVQKKLEETKNKIEKVVEEGVKTDPLLLDSEEANNYYRIQKEDGTFEKVTKRVTDRVKAWYKQRVGNKVFSDEEKQFNELKRKYGVEGHNDFQEIHSRYYNEDGNKRETPELDRPEKFNLPSQDMYDKLEKYYVDLVNSFPEGTLIFSEVIIYDEKQKEAGTIDFLAIEPSGKANILDWKFMNFGKDQEDIAWYKQGAYNVQIGRYKEILNKEYGVKEFGMLRAIPIAMKFENENKKDKKSPLQLTGIAIGSTDVSQIKGLKLLPVAEESESTGYDALDKIIKRLNGHLQQVGKESVTNEEERQFKIERLNILNKAIRLAHVTHNVVPLIDVIEVMRKEGDRILEDYNTSYKDKPATIEDFKNKQLSDFSDEMNDYIKLSEVFTDIGDELGSLIYTEEMKQGASTEEEKKEAATRKKYLDKLEEESKLIRRSRKTIMTASEDFLNKHVGERNLVFGLLNPEKIVKDVSSFFERASELPLKSVRLLTKLAATAQGKASEEAIKEITKLFEIRTKLSKRSETLSTLIHKIYQKDNKNKLVNKIVTKYNPQFYKEINKLATEGGDLNWLKENVDLEEYKKEVEKKIASMIEYISNKPYPGSPEEEEAIRDRERTKIRKLYDIDRKDFNGWNNYILQKHPKDKWISEEYRVIEKDADLLELYNFVINFNK